MSFLPVDTKQDMIREQHEHEMYHYIMRNGKLDENGFLISPPENMTDEQLMYYRKLLRERKGKIQYTV